MEEFFAKITEMFDFESQMYILMGAFFILLLLCFILLIVVGSRYKKLAEKVEELEAEREKAEPEKEPEKESEEKTVKQPELELFDDDSGDVPAEAAPSPEGQEPKGQEPKSQETEAKEIPAEAVREDGFEEFPEPEEETEASSETRLDGDIGAVAEGAVLAADQKLINETVENEINALKEKTDEIAKNQRKSFDKIKVVRYSSNLPDGTETIGYSIGITNSDRDGIVLTGTEQADGSTALVVKSVKNGVSKVPLTPAEDCAIMRGAKEK